MNNNPGCVYLIGAGPGDPELISVKGKKILEQCDVVIYDALVNNLLIATLPDRIQKIYVGKRGGKPSSEQAEINRLLVSHAMEGKMVVRLKGGDPLLLGRGSEEMEYLKEQGIPYQIIPGISSALAAPAWAGIPVTHRSLSRSVAIVTGHLMAGESVENFQLPEADTIVFLMAMQNVDLIIKKLISEGKFTRETPAAIIRNGTLPDQQVITGTLDNISAIKEKHQITAPAAFVVGKTASFASSLNWYKTPPLAGKRVVILRTPEQSDELIRTLYESGATVVPWPVLVIDPQPLDMINSEYLKPFTMVIFTSPNGVRIFLKSMLKNGIDTRHLYGKKIFAIGAGTAKVLSDFGLIPDGVPEKYVAEGITSILPENLNGENILIPRASQAREILPLTLKERGASVTVLPVYKTLKRTDLDCPVKDGDYVLFTSSSTVEFFFNHPECKDFLIIPCCIGDITAQTVRKYHQGEIFIAENATVASLVNTVQHAIKQGKDG
jgi:uroporphyrinogen III methyltransferase/synthase